MTVSSIPTGGTRPSRTPDAEAHQRDGQARKGLTNPVASVLAILIGIIWTIPTSACSCSPSATRHGQDTKGWWTLSGLTFDNYRRVLSGTSSILPNVMNSIVIVIPAAIIPIAVAAMAAYALVWIDFRGRDWIYIAIFALQVVPLQVAVVPLLRFVVNGAHIGSVTIFPAPASPARSAPSGWRTRASRCRWRSS